MSDITVKVSRHRITYTPEGGEEILLLDAGELVDAEPVLDGGAQVENTPLIGRAWAHHEATGNAQVTLRFDVHRMAGSPATAQAAGLEMWRLLTTRPNGVIRYRTAFVRSAKGCPLIDWEMLASCARVEHSDGDSDTAPGEAAHSYHLTYEFAVSIAPPGEKTDDEK